MSYSRNCNNCKFSTFGSYNPLSDICDSCTCSPDVGYGGFTDHSISDEFNASPHFFTQQDQNDFWANIFGDD